MPIEGNLKLWDEDSHSDSRINRPAEQNDYRRSATKKVYLKLHDKNNDPSKGI
jgi:hypothetical protein